jgi:hypothetical protein
MKTKMGSDKAVNPTTVKNSSGYVTKTSSTSQPDTDMGIFMMEYGDRCQNIYSVEVSNIQRLMKSFNISFDKAYPMVIRPKKQAVLPDYSHMTIQEEDFQYRKQMREAMDEEDCDMFSYSW